MESGKIVDLGPREIHPARPASPEGDIWDLVVHMWSMRWLIIAGTVTCVVVAAIASSMLERQYAAVSTVFVTPPQFRSQLNPPPLSVEAYARVAESDYVRDRVHDELKTQGFANDSVGQLTTVLYPSREPQKPWLPLIGLVAQTNDPAMSQRVANAWATVFVREQETLMSAGRSASVEFILREFPRASGELLEAERKLTTMRALHGRELTELRTRLAVEFRRSELKGREDYVIELQRKLEETKAGITESGRRMAELTTELSKVPTHLTSSKAITDDALWNSVTQKAASPQPPTSSPTPDVAERSRLTSSEVNPLHSELSKLQAGERVKYQSLQPIEKDFAQQLGLLREQASRARAALLAAEQQITALESQHKLEESSVQRQVDEARARFTKIEERIGDAQIAKDFREADIKIGALAALPGGPSSPRVDLIIGMAGVTGLVASLLAAWILVQVRLHRGDRVLARQ